MASSTSCPAAAKTFSAWATSDAHVVREALAEGFDPARSPRESLRAAIEQAEGPAGFPYDVAFQLGDLLDYDHETARNFDGYCRQLSRSARAPLSWYHVAGNNEEQSPFQDRVGLDLEDFRRRVDPVGEFTETSGVDNRRRPYPAEGTYERYHVDVGNLRFLFLGDRNDLPAPYGRGTGGFFVDGAITLESFEWLARQVLTFPERILAVACHHPLKDTTLGTGLDDSWKGRYMTARPARSPEDTSHRLQSVLHQVYPVHDFDTPLFRSLLGQNPGAVDLWLAGHVHHRVEERFDGRGKYAFACGTHHLNVGTLCRYRHFANIISAQSTLLSWTAGDDRVRSRVYIHDHPSLPSGFYPPEDRWLSLKTAFRFDAGPVAVRAPAATVAELRAEPEDARHVRLRWKPAGTGTLVVRSPSPAPGFQPADGAVYYAGARVPGGRVLVAGTARLAEQVPVGGEAGGWVHAFAYNAGGGDIRYAAGPGASVRLELR